MSGSDDELEENLIMLAMIDAGSSRPKPSGTGVESRKKRVLKDLERDAENFNAFLEELPTEPNYVFTDAERSVLKESRDKWVAARKKIFQSIKEELGDNYRTFVNGANDLSNTKKALELSAKIKEILDNPSAPEAPGGGDTGGGVDGESKKNDGRLPVAPLSPRPMPPPFNKLPEYTVPNPLKKLYNGYIDVSERNKDQFMVSDQIMALSRILERSITLFQRELPDAKMNEMNMLTDKIRALNELGRKIQEGMENVFTSIDNFVVRLRNTIMSERRDIDEKNETVTR